jgi:hypothetical protein
MEMRTLWCVASLVFFGVAKPSSGSVTGPYPPGKDDLYARPIRLVLETLPGERPSMERVRHLLETVHGFRYTFADPYRAALPDVTDRILSGDCKAKSLWLIDRMGDRHVRYVIGKIHRSSELHHAWVQWHDGSRWWILDPTNTSTPIAAEMASPEQYVALYSYSPGQEWAAESD